MKFQSPPPLVASYWTLAGRFPGRGEAHSRFGFTERVVAARKAGFCGLGLLDADLKHILQTSSLQECKRILDDQGITHLELEFLVDWFEEGEKRRAADSAKEFLFEAAAELGSSLIKVGDFSRSACPMPRLTDAFGVLCAQAQRRGVRIAFEPMGAAVIHDFDSALALVRGASAPNGGLAIDIWHMTDLGVPFKQVSTIPREFLFCVELNDAKTKVGVPSKLSEDRCFCGQGDLDIRGFIEAVELTGFDRPWGIELFSEELAQMGLTEAANLAFATSQKQFLSR